MSKIFYNGIEFGGSDDEMYETKLPEMTWDEYSELTTAQKMDGTIRFITDIDSIPEN